jgi:hypothetical protein
VLHDELRRQAHEWAERTALEQGRPLKVDDPKILRDACLLLGLIDHTGKRIKWEDCESVAVPSGAVVRFGAGALCL